jgi:hypothetical protein
VEHQLATLVEALTVYQVQQQLTAVVGLQPMEQQIQAEAQAAKQDLLLPLLEVQVL